MVPYAKRTLENGLEVIVHEDHHAPLVAVSVWYHTGSKNETLGRTGLAHLFEHLMFEGGAHQPRGYFEPLQEAGAALNGSTSTDRTNYWEVVPKEALRLALWMEADRMGWLVPVLTQRRVDTQREVVINERRQNYENTPYGQAGFALLDAIYPPDHPYAWPTIGRTDDLRAATLADIVGFFQTYYHPANASLVIAGDVEPEAAFDLVGEFFAEIPRGPVVRPPVVPAVTPTPRRLFLEDRVELPRLYLTWPSPALFEHGDAELDLAADLIGNGRTSRLYARLIYQRRVASEIGASQMSRELGGMFQIQATAAPGQSLDELRVAIEDEIARVASEGPDPSELERSRAEFEAAFVFRVQALGGFGGRADQLNAYNVYQRDPDGFDADLARYLQASVDSVQQSVARWLGSRPPVALSVVPAGRTALALPSPSQSSYEGGRVSADRPAPLTGPGDSRFTPPSAGAASSVRFPALLRGQLANGLAVWTIRHTAAPVVTTALLVRAGTADDPAAQPGLAAISADLAGEGADGDSAIQLANRFGRLGTRLEIGAGPDVTSLGFTAVARQFDATLDLLGAVACRPNLADVDLDRLRELRISRLGQLRHSATAVAERAFVHAVFPEHGYGHGSLGTARSLRATTSADVRTWHARVFRPDDAVLIVGGDVRHDEVLRSAHRAFGGWTGAASRPAGPATGRGPLPAVTVPKVVLVDRPGAPQSVLRIGHRGPARGVPAYHALIVLNAVLGGQFSSRINTHLRERRGVTYGARTALDARRDAGAFACETSVQADATASAIADVLAEFRVVREPGALTEDEITRAIRSLTRGYVRGFEIASHFVRAAAELAAFRLPDDTFDQFVPEILAQDAVSARQAAETFVHPEEAVAVVVGDRSVVERSLEALGRPVEVTAPEF